MSDDRPMRIRRSRAKGSRLPPNTICVSRGTLLGNPFRIGESSGVFPETNEILIPALTREQCVEFFSRMAHGALTPEMFPHGHDFMRRWRQRVKGMSVAEYCRVYMRGHNVACWCGLDDMCHGDVVLELSNPGAAAIRSLADAPRS